jgi:hypothetical protein
MRCLRYMSKVALIEFLPKVHMVCVLLYCLEVLISAYKYS